ncbi:hypothetical protein Tco_1114441 [Tanacetum coccineum]|uniref:Peptidase A2 domain-containing protein n=1 Tax=Tanacetum coccineum TaxID=301880 RepID=A0ABQ5IV46_9ASTR
MLNPGGDILGEEVLPTIRKRKWKTEPLSKKRATKNLNFFYQDIGTSLSAGGHLTQEEAAKKAIAIRMSQKFALLEEERPIIKTMAYNDKYKKILDEVWKDKVELDGKIIKEEEEAVKRIKGEALKEKEDPGAFIFPIRLEGQVNENALADTGSDINTMPFRIYVQLGRDDMKKVDRGITMVGVTTLIAKFLILDIPIDRDSPILVGRGFLRTIGAIVNTPERLFSTFDGFCHQTFRAARSDFMRKTESDSDDEEEYQIKRNKFEAPIYGPKPAPYLNCNDPDEQSLAIQITYGNKRDEAGIITIKTLKNKTPWKRVLLPQIHQEIFLWERCAQRYKVSEPNGLEKEEIETCSINIRSHTSTLGPNFEGRSIKCFTLWLESKTSLWVHANVTWVIAEMDEEGKERGAQKEEFKFCCGQFILNLARKCRVFTEVMWGAEHKCFNLIVGIWIQLQLEN